MVCMAVSNSLATIGSRNHVAFVDYRQKQTVHCIANVDHNHGIIPPYKVILRVLWSHKCTQQ